MWKIPQKFSFRNEENNGTPNLRVFPVSSHLFSHFGIFLFNSNFSLLLGFFPEELLVSALARPPPKGKMRGRHAESGNVGKQSPCTPSYFDLALSDFLFDAFNLCVGFLKRPQFRDIRVDPSHLSHHRCRLLTPRRASPAVPPTRTCSALVGPPLRSAVRS